MGGEHEPGQGPVAGADPAAGGQPARRRLWQRRPYQIAAAVAGVAALSTAGLLTQSTWHGAGRSVATAPGGAVGGPGQPPGRGDTGLGLGRNGTSPQASTRARGGGGAPPRLRPNPTAGSPGASAPANGTPADPATTSTTVINGILATVTNSGSLPRQHHTLRVVSARGDLAGQRELAWAADSGYAVGSARCTQNFRFNVDSPARVRPTLMLCWRTSPAKTVYTIAVDVDNRPSAAASVAVLNQVWTSMH